MNIILLIFYFVFFFSLFFLFFYIKIQPVMLRVSLFVILNTNSIKCNDTCCRVSTVTHPPTTTQNRNSVPPANTCVTKHFCVQLSYLQFVVCHHHPPALFVSACYEYLGLNEDGSFIGQYGRKLWFSIL